MTTKTTAGDACASPPGPAFAPDAKSSFANTAAGRASRWLVLPVLLGGSLWATWFGFAHLGMEPLLATLLPLLVCAVAVLLLERLLPYRRAWLHVQHGDLGVDVLHTLINQGVMVNLVGAALTTALAGSTGWVGERLGFSLWPHHWPLLAQLVLMTVISDFGAYWYHRLAHQTPWLWRFHAVHHSAPRLYFLNVTRTHPVESCLLSIPVTVPFIVMGTNAETIALYFTGTVVLGLLQHCNIDVRLGVLNRVFSVAELHRWHHSKLIAESDNNFGNNLIIWDMVFGTYLNPKDREVGDLGLLNPDYPRGYRAQLAAPFAKGDISKPPGYEHH